MYFGGGRGRRDDVDDGGRRPAGARQTVKVLVHVRNMHVMIMYTYITTVISLPLPLVFPDCLSACRQGAGRPERAAAHRRVVRGLRRGLGAEACLRGGLPVRRPRRGHRRGRGRRRLRQPRAGAAADAGAAEGAAAVGPRPLGGPLIPEGTKRQWPRNK